VWCVYRLLTSFRLLRRWLMTSHQRHHLVPTVTALVSTTLMMSGVVLASRLHLTPTHSTTTPSTLTTPPLSIHRHVTSPHDARSRLRHRILLSNIEQLISCANLSNYYGLFTRKSSYCFQRVLAIAILSVRLSVRHTGGSVKNGAS